MICHIMILSITLFMRLVILSLCIMNRLTLMIPTMNLITTRLVILIHITMVLTMMHLIMKSKKFSLNSHITQRSMLIR